MIASWKVRLRRDRRSYAARPKETDGGRDNLLVHNLMQERSLPGLVL